VSIRAGDLDTRVRIERRSTVQDAAGEPALAWELVAERWGSIERTPGSEVWASAQRSGRVPTVFRLRYLADVVPAMRVVVGARVYDIGSVVRPSGRAADMLLVTDELVEAAP
jgi:SPP1 family predicted phage head-tail adaptor